MPQTIETTDTTLTIHHTYDAPAARVYAALTTRDTLERWYAPGRLTAFEAQVGGRFDIRWIGPDGTPMGGFDAVFTALEPHRRVAHTLHMLDSGDAPPSLVTFELHEREGQTELVLRHTRMAPTEVERGTQGWPGALERLAELL